MTQTLTKARGGLGFEIVRVGNAILLCGDNRNYDNAVQAAISLQHSDIEFEDMAVISDPPYGIRFQHDYSHGGKRPYGAFKPLHEGDIEHDPTPWLIGKKQIFWGANHYAHNLPHNGRWLCWDKRCQVVPSRHQADFELAWCSEYGAGRMFYHVWDGFMRDSEKGEERVHPTQKPIAVMEWCLEFAKEKLILDPYMGSGTTGVAAVKNGRQFIGIEYDPEYFEQACIRIAKAQSTKLPQHMQKGDQVDLFI